MSVDVLTVELCPWSPYLVLFSVFRALLPQYLDRRTPLFPGIMGILSPSSERRLSALRLSTVRIVSC